MGVYLRGKSWYIDFYYEGKRYTEKVGKVAKNVAEEKLDIKRSEVIRGEWKPKKIQISFDKFKEEYLELTRGDKKPKSSLRDECSLKHLSKAFDGKMLSEINPLLIERYKKTRKEEGAEPATINRELGCLRHMFNMAIAWGKAQSYPFGFGKNKVKLLKEPKGKDRILSEDEEARLLEAVRLTTKSQHLEPIIITALNTGMRKGEILNLKWSNVDFKTGHILVEETKNGEIRRVPMNKKLTAILESGKKISKGEYVFSENGKPYGDVKTGWWSALKKAKIEGFRFHDLRHTFGSRLGMAGVDIRTIQELMGHKDIKMTMRYSHPTPEHKKNAVKMLDGVTTFFTTVDKNPDSHKVVSIGSY
jgi:integrase